eukprot:gnl/Hemi2/8320_TR2871_c0_g1_i1.p1 gnl/Hemi2/8320_TR2871_c0_g1~~gnl/Hemi2/8320_TR2871_c0_g1_i1.p1  ORF type:complete len:337 (+),score=46.16 gnl/Hemi2/8320_TR2871_c0_g1_i1:93-1103(+)
MTGASRIFLEALSVLLLLLSLYGAAVAQPEDGAEVRVPPAEGQWARPPPRRPQAALSPSTEGVVPAPSPAMTTTAQLPLKQQLPELNQQNQPPPLQQEEVSVLLQPEDPSLQPQKEVASPGVSDLPVQAQPAVSPPLPEREEELQPQVSKIELESSVCDSCVAEKFTVFPGTSRFTLMIQHYGDAPPQLYDGTLPGLGKTEALALAMTVAPVKDEPCQNEVNVTGTITVELARVPNAASTPTRGRFQICADAPRAVLLLSHFLHDLRRKGDASKKRVSDTYSKDATEPLASESDSSPAPRWGLSTPVIIISTIVIVAVVVGMVAVEISNSQNEVYY